MTFNSNSGGGLGVQEPGSIRQGRARARVKCPATAGSSPGFYRYRDGGIEFVPLQSERHPVIQKLIDVFCIAWWCFFASVTGLGIVWAMFVLWFVAT